MNILQLIPAQVYFLLAFGAVMALLGDTAVRSWRSPERVADPSFMWPRAAPVLSDRRIGPRLPGGSFRMPEAGLRLGWGPGGSFFESVEAHPVARPFVLTTASASLARPLVVVPPAGAAFWSQVEGGEVVDTSEPASTVIHLDNSTGTFTPHEGATEAWSPIDEIGIEDVEHEALPLSLDEDTRVWLAERLARYDAAIARIEGDAGREFEDALGAFQRASFELPAYRRRWVASIEDTGEISGDTIRRALARV